MPILTAIFLSLSVLLAVVLGPKLEAYLWGPGLLALGMAAVSALISLWRQPKLPDRQGITILGLLLAGWVAWRCSQSPVAELAQADLLLLLTAVSGFLCVFSIFGHGKAEQTLALGIAGVLLANTVVIGIQAIDPSFRAIYAYGIDLKNACGFYTHYNYAANFQIAASFVVLGLAAFSHWSRLLRVTLGIIAVLGLGAIWFTLSRGGFLATVVGLGVFSSVLLIHGKQRKAKWFPLAAIGFPLIALTLLIFLINGWEQIQQLRNQAGGVEELMDNKSRLPLLGAALSCIARHPLYGGGSRSFSWEFMQVWDQGYRETTPDLVHNEWMQMATDYGLIGLALLFTFIGTAIISGIIRCLFATASEKDSGADAWRLAGITACIAILTQACFSFVFHIQPGALMLGMALAMSCAAGPSARPIRTQTIIQSLALAAGLLFMLPSAWKGTQASRWLIETLHSKDHAALPSDRKISNLNHALEVWPTASLYRERAIQQQIKAAQLSKAGEDTEDAFPLAISDYRNAIAGHPYDGHALLNLANLLSQLDQPDEAEVIFEQAVQTVGKLEGAYRSHYLFAKHLQRRAIILLTTGKPEEALRHAIKAVEQIDSAYAASPSQLGSQGRSLQISCHELLGMLLEGMGRNDEAIASYQTAANLHQQSGRRINLRAAMVKARQANELWFQRQPEQALGLFLQARQLSQASHGQLPEGISAQERDAFNKKLNTTIQILQTAKIVPAEVK